MRKTILLAVALLGSGVCGGSYWWYCLVTSPDYSLAQIARSVKDHDLATFEHHVDIEGIVTRILGDLPDLVSTGTQTGLLGERAAQVILGLVQQSIVGTARESVRSFVDRGHFENQLTGRTDFSRVLRGLEIDTLSVLGVKGIRREGKVAYVTIDMQIQAYEGSAQIEFMMRDRGRYWQIAEISNLKPLINALSELKRNYPYRDLAMAVFTISRSTGEASGERERLSRLARYLVKANHGSKARFFIDQGGQWDQTTTAEILCLTGNEKRLDEFPKMDSVAASCAVGLARAGRWDDAEAKLSAIHDASRALRDTAYAEIAVFLASSTGQPSAAARN